MAFFILFHISLYFLKVISQECLIYDSSSLNNCSFCSYQYYLNESFNSETDLQKCFPKTQPYFEKFIYISNKTTTNESNHSGSIQDPYEDLMVAFATESSQAMEHLSGKIIFNLIGDNHYLISNVDSLIQQLFRRTLLDIVIKPLFCDEYLMDGCFNFNDEKVTIILKTDEFAFYISKSLIFQNVILLAADLSLDIQSANSQCLTEKTSQCCLESDLANANSDCSLISKSFVSNNLELYSLFNLEMIIDNSNFTIPSLSIENCDFKDFYSFKNSHRFMCLVSFLSNFPGNFSGTNFTIEGFFFLEGLLSQETTVTTAYIISENGSYSLNLNIFYSIDLQINLQNAQIIGFNRYNLSLNSPNYFIYLESFIGSFEIKNTTFSQNNNVISLIYIDSSPLINTLIDANNFIDNQGSYLVKISSSNETVISDCNFTNNSILSLILLYQNDLLLVNTIIMNSQIPVNNFIEFQFSVIMISGCSFLNLWSLTQGYYMFVSQTSIQESMDILMINPAPNIPPFAKDMIVFNENTFMNTNLNLFISENSIISFELNNCIIKNVNSFDGVAFISTQTEVFMKISSTCIDNFQSNFKFLYLSYTRNMTYLNFCLTNSTFFYFSDIYSITNIDETANATKNVLEIIDCQFYNISLIASNGQNTNFFYIMYYTMYHGFFLLNISNSLFDTIYNQIFADDILFYFAVGHHFVENSTFKDIANMTLFKMYVRVSDANISLLNTNFIMQKFQFARFYYVSMSYNINLLTIKNTLFKGNYPIFSPYSMEFLQVQGLIFSNVTVQNIFSSSGASIRIYLLKLRNCLIENSQFFNNSGVSDNGADLIIQISYYEDFDWTYLPEKFDYTFGILNCSFKNTKVSGSITLLDQGEMILYNSTFENIEGMNGAVLNAGSQSNVLIWSLKVTNSYSSGSGGCFSFSQSNFIIIGSSFYNTSSTQSGGVIMATKQSLVIIKNSNFELCRSNEGGTLTAEDTELDLENNVFLNSESIFQGGFFCLRRSEIKMRNISMIGGNGLTGAGIHAELVLIDFENFLIEGCSSSMENGLGVIFLSGVYGENSSINRFICRGNKAMSGSCIYAKDIVLSLTNGEILSNVVGTGSLIVIFQASLYTELKINKVEFTNNTAGIAIIQSEFCSIQFQSSIFIDNIINTYLIYLVESFLVFSNMTISSSIPSNLDLIIYLIYLDSSPGTVMENDYFFGEMKFGLLSINDCDDIRISNSIFLEGKSSSGGAISSSNCIITISYTKFTNNYANQEGGAIFINGAPNTILTNCIFSSNFAQIQGADLFIEDPDISENTFCELIIQNSHFSNSFFYSMLINSVYEVNLINVTFIGLGTEICNQGFGFYDILNITIDSSSFFNYGCLGIGYFQNYEDEVGSLNILGSKFINGTSNSSGGLFSIYGGFNIYIRSSSFINGFCSENGGAIFFFCGNYECSLYFAEIYITIFQNNSAALLGGAIYSQSTEVKFDEKHVIFIGNIAPLGQNIFTFPAKIFIFTNLDIAGMEEYLNETFSKNLIDQNFTNNVSEIQTKSSYYINLGIIVTDYYNNLIKYDSDSIFSIIFQGNDSLNVSLENNIVQLNEGWAIFNMITVIADPGNYELSIKSESEELEQNITFILNPCGRGDIIDGKRCLKCSEGFYSIEENPQILFSEGHVIDCEICPDNAGCPGGDKIIPDEGFWRFDENSTLILSCLESSACPYQTDYEQIDVMAFEFQCASGYWGNLCLNCEKGYGRGYQNCFVCDSNEYYVTFTLQLFFLIFMSLLESYLVGQMKIKSSKTLIKILFYHNAFLMTITTSSNDLTSEMKELFEITNNEVTLTPSIIYNFNCFIYYFNPKIDRESIFKVNLLIQILVPIFYTLILFLIKTLTDLIYRIYSKSKLSNSLENFLILFYISYRNWYPRVILYTIFIFQCIDLGPGSYVSESPNLICFGAEHKNLMYFLSIPSILLWSIGVPAITYYFLRKKNNEINTGNQSIIMTDIKGIYKYPKKFGRIYHCLVSDYNKKYPYWQVFEFFILTFCLFVSQISNIFDDLIRRMLLFLVYGIFFLIYLKLEPFRDGVNTAIMCLSFIICIFTLIFEIIGSNEDNVAGVRDFAENFILAINALFFCLFFLAISKKWLEENKIMLFNIGSGFKKISQNIINRKNLMLESISKLRK